MICLSKEWLWVACVFAFVVSDVYCYCRAEYPERTAYGWRGWLPGSGFVILWILRARRSSIERGGRA